jgi:hypothetical protein
VKFARTLLATACLAMLVAGAGQAQQRPRGGPVGGSVGRMPAGQRGYGPPPAYGRGNPAPAYGRGGPPPGYGRGPNPAPGGYGRSPQLYPQGYPPAYGRYGGYNAPYEPRAALGGWREQQDVLRQGVRHGQLAPLGRVIGSIRQVTPGRQLDAQIEYLGPRMVYRVQWVTSQGRRVDYIVDAASGAILNSR